MTAPRLTRAAAALLAALCLLAGVRSAAARTHHAMAPPGLAAVALAALAAVGVRAGTTCTHCMEDFSSLMTRRGSGGGAIVALQPPYTRNEPSAGWRIDWRDDALLVNGPASFSWTGTGFLNLELMLPQAGLNAGSPGTFVNRPPLAMPRTGSAPPLGACAGAADGVFHIAERWGVIANFRELSADVAVSPAGSPVVGLVWAWRDPLNYYAVVQRASAGEACTGVFKVVRGVVTPLGSATNATFTPSAPNATRVWNRLSVARNGSEVRVWMNGRADAPVLVLSDADPGLPHAAVGIFAAGVNQASWDSLQVIENPTCSDGVQNGEEQGVDCSGACPTVCPATIETTTNWPPLGGTPADSHFIGWHRETHGAQGGAPIWRISPTAGSEGQLEQTTNVGLAFLGTPGGTSEWVGASFLLCNRCGRAVDQDIEVDVFNVDNDYSGVVGRYVDRDNMHMVYQRVESPLTAVHRRRAGANRVLWSSTNVYYFQNTWVRLRLRQLQNRLTLWVDGNLVVDTWDSDPLLMPGYAGVHVSVQEGVRFRYAKVVNYRVLNAATVCGIALPGLSPAGANALALHTDANKAATMSVLAGIVTAYLRGSTAAGHAWYSSQFYTPSGTNNLPLVTVTPRGATLNFNRGASLPAWFTSFPRYEADADADGFTLVIAFTTPTVSTEATLIHKGGLRGVPGWRLSILPGAAPTLAFTLVSNGADGGAAISHRIAASAMTVAGIRVAPVPGSPTGAFNVTGVVNGVPFANRTDATFNGTAGVGLSNYLYLGADEATTAASRYTGSVSEVALFSAALSDDDFANTTGYLAGKLGALPFCPRVGSLNLAAVSGGCLSGTTPNGQSCTLACAPGFALASGSLRLTCTAGIWSAGLPFCQRACANLTAPNTAKSGCSRGLFGDTFDAGNATLTRWAAFPPFPLPWVVRSGELLGPATTFCGDPPRFVSALVISNPYWQNQLFERLRISTRVRIDRAVTIYPRFVDLRNYLALTLDAQYNGIRFEAVSNAAVTTLCSSITPQTVSGRWYDVSIELFNNGTIVARRDDALICTAVSSILPFGTAGVGKMGESAAVFDHFTVEAVERVCPQGCVNMTEGALCTLTCDPGMSPLSGNLTRFCSATGNFTGVPLVCGIRAPAFPPLAASVRENSPSGTLVGTANATLPPGTRDTVLYEIVGGNAGGAFSIEPCSGALRVAAPEMLDFEQVTVGRRAFTLLLRALIAGVVPAAESFANASITVLDANDPPRLLPALCAVPESAGAGAVVCTLTAVDEDVPPQPSVFSIAYGSGDGATTFALGAASGVLTVARAGALDFERVPQFTLAVRVADAGDLSLATQAVVTVSVVDVNEPPVITSPGFLEVDQSSLAPGATLGGPVTADDPDAGSAVNFTLSANPLVGLAGDGSGMLVCVGSRAFPGAPYERDGRLVMDVLDLTLTATDNGAPPLAARQALRVYVLANVSGAGGLPVVRTVEVRPANPASGSGSVPGGRHFIQTDGSDSVAFGCSGLAANAGATFRLRANATGVPGAPPPWNVTCSVRLEPAGGGVEGVVLCPTGVGWGTGWDMALTMQPTGAPAPVAVLRSVVTRADYAPPVVTSIAVDRGGEGGADPEVATTGGTPMILQGFGFGGPAAPVAAAYGPCNATTDACAYRYAFTVTGATHTTLRVLTAPGVGAGLRVRVTVGNQTAEPHNVQVAYAPPRITSVSRPDTTNDTVHQLRGPGAVLLIRGRGFGPASGAPEDRPRLSYGPDAATALPLPFAPAEACTFPQPDQSHTLIACRSAAGLGANLTLVVSVGGQFSPRTAAENASVSYAPPVVTAVYGAGSRELDTRGGQVISLAVQGVGPAAFSAAGSPAAVFPPPAVTYGGGNRSDEFNASACTVADAGDSAGVVTCVTGEGSGGVGGLLWRLQAGGQLSEPFRSGAKYAAPVITGFAAAGAVDASTEGWQEVVVQGRNFGPAGAPLDVEYDAVAAVGSPPVETTLTFRPPVPCVKPPGQEHEALVCATAPGGGAPLTWRVSVSGQLSAQPVTSYGPPFISGVVLGDAPGDAPVTDASPDGGTRVRILGGNFGPPWLALPSGANATLAQWVELLGPGASASSPSETLTGGGGVRLPGFTVLSHRAIAVTLPPGIGRDLQLRVSVADQVSPASDAVNGTVSYARPAVVRVAPATAGTPGGVLARVFCAGCGLLDPGVDHTVTLGGREVRVVERQPPRGAANASGVNASAHSFLVEVPPGAGAQLPVVVTAYRRANPAWRVSSSPAADGAPALFSYSAPTIAFVTVRPATDPGLADAINATLGDAAGGGGGLDLTALRVLIITCANAGPSADFGALQANAASDAAVLLPGSPGWEDGRILPLPGGWSHDRITAVSTLTSGSVRIAVPVNDPATGAPAAPLLSNAVAFSDLSPVVVELDGVTRPTGNFSTAGGDVAVIGVRNLASAAARVNVTVGGAHAAVLDPATGAEVPPARVVADVIAPQVAAAGGGDTQALLIRLRIRIPPGQGSLVAVTIYRDGTPGTSVDGVGVGYAPPTLATADVAEGDGANRTTAGGLVTVAVGPGAVVRVPTAGGMLTLAGANLGTCPVVTLGPLLRGAACGADARPDDALTVLSRTHDAVAVAVPPGEGGVWDLTLAAGDQSAGLTGGYRLPSVSRVEALGGAGGLPTQGGAVSITGADFGRLTGPTPDVTVALNATLSVVCADVARDPARPHNRLTCTLPPGSGANLTVVVALAGQVSVSPGALSFNAPRVGGMARQVPSGDDGGATTDGPPGGPAVGGYTVRLTGTDFGTLDPAAHCLVLSTTRNPAGSVACNGLVDAWTEYEVPPEAVVAWNHTQVTFTMPAMPGGVVYAFVVARGQASPVEAPPGGGANASGLAAPPAPSEWRFDPPLIESVDPATFVTEGRELVTVACANGTCGFGPTVADNARRSAPGFVPASLPAPRGALPNGGRGAPSGAYLRVNFFSPAKCVSSAVADDAGARPPSVARCKNEGDTEGRTEGAGRLPAGYGVVTHEPGRVAFVSLPGVGRNRSLTLTVVNADGVETTSPPFQVSYSPPTIDRVDPSRVQLREAPPPPAPGDRAPPPATTSIVAYGRNYGPVDTTGWSDDERLLEMSVGGVACAAPVRLQTPTSVGIQCLFDASAGGNASGTPRGGSRATPAGYRSVVVRVAGQLSPPSHPTLLQFVCEKGFYALPGETCLACPEGASCAGYDPDGDRAPGAELANRTAPDGSAFTECVTCYQQPLALPGWWNMKGLVNRDGASESTCPPQRLLEGRVPLTCDHVVRCEPPEACAGGNVCAEGYASRAWPYRCSTCEVGFYRSNGVCKRCPEAPELSIVAFLAVAVVALAGGYVLNKRAINLAFLTIGVDFLQVVSIFAQAKVAWPPQMLELFRVMSAFNLNLDTLNLECSFRGITYTQKWSAAMALPVVLAALLVALAGANLAWGALVKRQKLRSIADPAPLISVLLLVLYFLYLYLSRTVFDVFTCRSTVPPDLRPDGSEVQYMAGVFEPCGGPLQLRLLPFAVTALLLYVVGYPAMVGVLLRRNAERICQDQLLRAKGVGDDRLTNPHAYDLRRRLGRLYYQFRPGCYGWALAILLRKFCISIASLVFNQSPQFQLAGCLLVLFLAFAAHLRSLPYMSPSSFDAELARHAAAVRAGDPRARRMEATLAHVAARGRKKSRTVALFGSGADALRARGLRGGAAAVGRALHAVFGTLIDANTVEAVLLAAGMLVAIFGILFSATQNTVGASASAFFQASRDAVLACALGTIILAILYWLFVLVVDLVSLVQTQRASAAAAAAAAKRRKRAPGLSRGPDGDSASSIATEATDSSVNPLFLTGASGGDLGDASGPGGPLTPEALAGMAKPDPATWAAVRDAYLAALEANEELTRRLAAQDGAKRDGGQGPAGARGARALAEFQPLAAGSAASSRRLPV